MAWSRRRGQGAPAVDGTVGSVGETPAPQRTLPSMCSKVCVQKPVCRYPAPSPWVRTLVLLSCPAPAQKRASEAGLLCTAASSFPDVPEGSGVAVTTSHSLQGDVGSVTGSPESCPQGGRHQPPARRDPLPAGRREGYAPETCLPALALAGDHPTQTPGAILSASSTLGPTAPPDRAERGGSQPAVIERRGAREAGGPTSACLDSAGCLQPASPGLCRGRARRSVEGPPGGKGGAARGSGGAVTKEGRPRKWRGRPRKWEGFFRERVEAACGREGRPPAAGGRGLPAGGSASRKWESSQKPWC